MSLKNNTDNNYKLNNNTINKLNKLGFTFIKYLSKGKFGKTFIIEDKSNREKYVLKQIKTCFR